MVKNLPTMQETQEMVSSVPGMGRSLEEEMATHSSIFAWRIPWTEKPGGLQSMGSQRVRHDWVINTSTNNQAFWMNILLNLIKKRKGTGFRAKDSDVEMSFSTRNNQKILENWKNPDLKLETYKMIQEHLVKSKIMMLPKNPRSCQRTQEPTW